MGMIFFMILSIIFLAILVVSVCYIFILKKKLEGMSSDEFARLQNQNEKLTQSLEVLNTDYNILRDKAAQLMYLRDDLVNKMPDLTSGTNDQKLDQLLTFWTNYFGDEKFFLKKCPDGEQFFKDLRNDLEDTKHIELMQKRVTEPFFKKLSQSILEPVEVREMVVKMAMMLYDTVSFTSPNSRPIEQGLNKSVVLREEEISEEEAISNAYDKAKVISDLEVETALWVRNLANGLRGLGLDNKKLILSGYKFAPQPVGSKEQTQEKTDLVD